jgi:hypothetical protein
MAQGRRVRRVVRRIDTWSVLKVSSLFFGSVVLVLLIAGILLWAAGSAVGAVGGFEKFMSSIGFEDFTFSVSQLLRGFVAFGLVVVALGTGMSVLAAVVYNLISDLAGGIELTVLEEDLRPVRAASPAAPVADARASRPEEHELAPGYPA